MSEEIKAKIYKILKDNLKYGNPTSRQDHIEFTGFWLEDHLVKAGEEIYQLAQPEIEELKEQVHELSGFLKERINRDDERQKEITTLREQLETGANQYAKSEAENLDLKAQLEQQRALIDGYNKMIQGKNEELAEIESHYASIGLGLYTDKDKELQRLKAQLEAKDKEIAETMNLLRRQNDANEFDGHGPVQEIREFFNRHRA